MESVSERLEALEKNDPSFTIAKLKDHRAFLDAVIEATKTAVASRSTIKKDALLNALENIAKGNIDGEITDSTYLKYIDELDEIDIQIIGILDRPFDRRSDPISAGIYPSYEKLLLTKFTKLSPDILNIKINNLFNMGLLLRSADRIGEQPEFLHEDRSLLTKVGKDFLSFIMRPD